jgi:hypothetical protein
MNIAWAQKSALLDNQKALKNQIECQRIADLQLIKTDSPIKINCQLDNMTFYSDVPLKEEQGPIKIGNFNLLHPGTDKTLFKDMGLVAELIDKEFDVMAGVELVDVLASPRGNNLLILPIIDVKAKDLKSIIDQIQGHKGQITELSKPTEPAGPSDLEKALKQVLEQKQISLQEIANSIYVKKSDLNTASEEVSENSIPGKMILGIEISRKKRLKRLAAAQTTVSSLEKDLTSLEKQQSLTLSQVSDIQNQIKNLPQIGGINEANLKLIAKLKQSLSSLEIEEKNLAKDLAQITRYYRIPGYLRILEELRKIDASWSLIISPHGDAAVESNTQELTGFYYRASKIELDKNIHCSKRFNRTSSGCYPNFYADYMGEDKATLFSRRPFMATFSDGKKPFSIIAAHVVFESAAEPEAQKEILEKTFNVSALNQLPTGINKQNYARFAETFLTLQLIDKLKAEGLERIIYTGDFNLESKNPFWKYLFDKVSESVLLIDVETSLSENRFVQGKESKGVSSNYDHFILSAVDASFCRNASVVNFLENDFTQRIKDKYLVRVEASKAPYQQEQDAGSLIAKRSQTIQNMLENYNFLVNKTNQITNDTKTTTEDMNNFQARVFDSQFSDETYYKYFSQIISDHLPIRMECEF